MTGSDVHSKGPLVQKGITTGNVLSMVTTAIGVVGVIVAVTTSYSNTNKDVQSNFREITAIKAGLETARASIRQLEISEARTMERYNSIISNVGEMKASLSELSELLRETQRENQNRGNYK